MICVYLFGFVSSPVTYFLVKIKLTKWLSEIKVRKSDLSYEMSNKAKADLCMYIHMYTHFDVFRTSCCQRSN